YMRDDFSGLIYPVGNFETPRDWVELRMAFQSNDSGEHVSRLHSVRIPVKIVPTMSDAITPVAGDEIDRLMRAAIWVELAPPPPSGCGNTAETSRIGIRFDRHSNSQLADLAMGFFVDIMAGDRVAESIPMFDTETRSCRLPNGKHPNWDRCAETYKVL